MITIDPEGHWTRRAFAAVVTIILVFALTLIAAC